MISNKITKIFAVTVSTFIMLFVLQTFAAGGIVQCGNTASDPCTFNDVIEFINRIINWIGIASVIIATITFTMVGAKILMNPGNSSALGEAKKAAQSTFIGLFFLLCGWLIVDLILKGLGAKDTIYKFLK